MISERIKWNTNNGILVNYYFWRTHSQQEIDYLEEKQGKLFAFEFKWKSEKKRIPKSFINNYPDSKVEFIRSNNYDKFVGLVD